MSAGLAHCHSTFASTKDKMMKKLLFIDTETCGIPYDFDEPAENISNWPRMVQCGYILAGEDRNIIEKGSMIIRPDNFIIPDEASSIHGITTEYALENGVPVELALLKIELLCREADIVVGHNITFDEHIIDAEFCRAGKTPCIRNMQEICTMMESTEYCGLPNFKWPKLCELHEILFAHNFEGAHDAMADIQATFRCFWKLVDIRIIRLSSTDMVTATEVRKTSPVIKILRLLVNIGCAAICLYGFYWLAKDFF